jgi:type IX secretion system PorP/SprF family membrane protein
MKNNLLMLFIKLVAVIAFLPGKSYAQVDPHFSQYYNQPMMVNPALTGAIEGDYRGSAIFRSQYGNTLQTKGMSGEVVTNKNSNFGLNIFNESSTDQAYSYTNAYLSYAYTGVRFGPNADHYLVLALQGGFLNRRFDPAKLQFGDQWTAGVGYQGDNSSGEVFNNTSVLSFDAGVGAAYYDAVPDKKVSFFGGVSAFHVNSPASPFLSGDGGERLPVRYSVQAGARIVASDLFNLVPSIIYMREGGFSEKMVGAYLQLYAGEQTDVIVGTNYRLGDAVIPFAGFYYKGMTVGMSYDVTVSQLSTAGTHTGSFEVSLSFVGFGKNSLKTKPFYCPRF